jgi:hypothetical protein
LTTEAIKNLPTLVVPSAAARHNGRSHSNILCAGLNAMFDEKAITNRWIMRAAKLAAAAGAVLLAGWRLAGPLVSAFERPAATAAIGAYFALRFLVRERLRSARQRT